MSQEPYTKVSHIPLDRERRVDPDQPLTAEELKQVQSVTGGATWLSTQTRPDLSWSVSEVSGIRTVEALEKANRLVTRTKNNSNICLRFPKRPIASEDLALLVLKSELPAVESSADGCVSGYMLH